jgi:hypothetical protein
MSGGTMSGPMSCPDWNGLVALRERKDAEPAGWAEAVAHLDACPRCRPRAMAADPLLVFRRLPGAEIPEAGERAEAEAMIQAVAAMRTAKRLESRRSFAGWRRWAAAAVLALASLAVGRDRSPVATPEPAAPVPAASAAIAPLAPAAGAATLEALDGSNVYQIDGKDLTTFMVVGNKVDV